MKRTKITNKYKKHIFLGLANVLIGMSLVIVCLLMFPIGLLFVFIPLLILGLGMAQIRGYSKAICPHCGNIVKVSKSTKIFKCYKCKRKISKINEYLEAI